MTSGFNRLAFLENSKDEASQGALGMEQNLREEVLDLRSQLAVAQAHLTHARPAHSPTPDGASIAALLRDNAELRETIQRLSITAESAGGRVGRTSAPARRGEEDDAGCDALGRDGPETALGAVQVRRRAPRAAAKAALTMRAPPPHVQTKATPLQLLVMAPLYFFFWGGGVRRWRCGCRRSTSGCSAAAPAWGCCSRRRSRRRFREPARRRLALWAAAHNGGRRLLRRETVPDPDAPARVRHWTGCGPVRTATAT
jgi:hypothetical protein